MHEENASFRRMLIVHRLFFVQLSLIALGSILVAVAAWLESRPEGPKLGYFWFAFLCGALGASVGMIRRLNEDDSLAEELARSVVSTLMPLLYGAVLAGVTYGLFMSQIISGELFPQFNNTQSTADIHVFLAIRPKSIPDVFKLMIWCFFSGYSERFVTNILGRLEQQSEKSDLPSS